MRTATGCDACEMLTINGLACHETGCPDAWRDHDRECDWCGQRFQPEAKGTRVCSDDCAESYYG